MTRKLFFVTMLLLGWYSSSAQRFSNKGRDFWAGYGLHYAMEIGENSQQMVLYLSAEEEEAHVTVTTYGEKRLSDGSFQKVTEAKQYTVPRYSVISTENMPKFEEQDCTLYDVSPAYGGKGSDRLFDRSIHVESDKPIVAYAHISGSFSSGATMLMPVESWGYSYVSLNIEQKLQAPMSPGENCSSWLFIVANYDNTVVEITPSVPLQNGRQPNIPFTTTINKGQIYQVVAAPINQSTGYDLTGTKIRSVGNSNNEAFPVAVFTGSSATGINCSGTNSGSADNLIQQITPIHAWGRRYLTAPFSSSDDATALNPCIYRIAVRDPATVVKKNGVVMPVSGLKKGFYYEFVSATADYIEADKAVLVAQYMPSTGQCGYKGLGDPEIVYLSPLEQAIEHLGFFRNTDLAIQVNYLTLIIPDQGLTSLKIDGSQSFTYKYPHPNKPGYTVVVQRWPATKSQCIVNSDSAFTSVTYGVGVAESYAFNGGTLVNNLNGTLSLHNVEGKAGVQHPFTCTNSPVEISLLMTYEPTKLVWHLSELTKMTPNADITENNPVSKGIVTIKGLSYYKYTVPGTYNFSETGTFRFTVSSTNPAIENYNNIENLLLDVVVKDVNHTAAFDYTFSGCISDLVHFKWDPTPAAGVYTIDRWAWTIPEGPVGVKDTANRLFSSNGTKDITLKVITEEGCIGSKTKQIKLEFPVVMKITASPLEICEDETVDFEATATNTGSAPISGWYWDFGNGQTATTQNPQDVKYTAYRDSYTVKMVGKAGKDCVTDTVTQVIKVNARPYTRFSYPAGCLPADGVIAFTSEATAPDGSLLRTHAWNFGDGNAGAANPNTSAQESPSHAFGLGSYDIHYTVTTEKGCQKDTLVKAQFTVKPQMTFASLASVCENAVVLSIAKATVTNSVPGTGVYKGKGTDAAGNFDPVMAGPGLHEIKYIFTSTGGCMDSVTSNITVWAAPKAAFSITKDACPGKDVTITDQSPAVSPAISTWYWQLGDNTSVTNNNGNTFTKTYTDSKSYEVQLTVTDTRGCASTVTKQTVTIHPEPKAAFTPPASICLPGEATFTNQSTTADNSTLQYEWNMGDGSTVRTTKDATHTYAAAGTYPVSLKVTTAYGCIAAASQQVKNFYDKPTALFTVAPQAVCQGKDHVFTDKSTTPNGSISSWKWDFDDGKTSALRNPVKQYATAGSYTVKLVVTDVAGCASTAYPLPVTAYVQPVIDAGEMISVVKGNAVTFKATANRPDAMQFAWTPAAELTNANTLSPTYIATHDEVFTLTATSNQGNCTATDQLTVKVLKIITPPTAFTPNGDGIHDKWEIEGLSEYLQCQVQVFNRYGQSVYLSTGYNKPWDGTMNSKLLPAGTYYYIIADKGSSWQRIAGAVTIIR